MRIVLIAAILLASFTGLHAQAQRTDRLFAVAVKENAVIVAPYLPGTTVDAYNAKGVTVTFFSDIFFLNDGVNTVGSGEVTALQSGDAFGNGYVFPQFPAKFDFEGMRAGLVRTASQSSVSSQETEAYVPDFDAIRKAARFMEMEVAFEAGTPGRLANLGYAINERALVLESAEGNGVDIDLKGRSIKDRTLSALVSNFGKEGVKIVLTSAKLVETLTLEPNKAPVSRTTQASQKK